MGLGVAIGIITIAVVGYFVWAALKLKSNMDKGKGERKPGED